MSFSYEVKELTGLDTSVKKNRREVQGLISPDRQYLTWESRQMKVERSDCRTTRQWSISNRIMADLAS